MENDARDDTDDWRLPQRVTPTIAELEARIDEAIAIARASEAAAMTVGATAIESAERAQRTADLAIEASRAVDPGEAGTNGLEVAGAADSPVDERMARFLLRADRLGARVAQLQCR